MRRGAALLLVSACLAGPCAAACTATHSSPRPTPIPSGSVPTAQQLVSAYGSTLAHERFRFDSKSSDVEYVGTLDLAHDGLDISQPGTGQLEIRFLGSREWARNAFATWGSQQDALLNPDGSLSSAFPSVGGSGINGVGSPEDSQTWVILPGADGNIESHIPLQILSAALLAGLDRGGTSPVQNLGAADVKGTATVGYQWSVTLAAALDSFVKIAPGSKAQVQVRLDSEGRVTELRLIPPPAAASSPAPAPTGSGAPLAALAWLDMTLTLYDFSSAEPITAPPNPITVKQLNAQQ